jgi:ribonuclease HII
MTRKFDPSLLPPTPDLSLEGKLWQNGVRHIAGIDEAGRGALAGPVSAAAIILPASSNLETRLNGVRDSKKMTPRQRSIWAGELINVAIAWGVGFASHQEIDEFGIVPATRIAAMRALSALTIQPQHLLIDALLLYEESTPQTALIKGDARSLSIASASVLAKVTRDAYLREMDGEYPGYGFASHKGYGTSAHRLSISEKGPCPIHRLSFAPFRHY